MSGIGHLAAGIAAKTTAPTVPLWVWLVASEWNDLLYGVLSVTGVEPRSEFTMDFSQGVRYLSAGTNPWSHGLFMSLVWAGAAAALAYRVYRSQRAAGLLGLVVLSHWALDFLMHANLPLFFAGSPELGLGLENSGPGFILLTILDLVLVAVAVFFYWRARKRSIRPAR